MITADLYVNTLVAVATIISLILANYSMINSKLSYIQAKVEDLDVRVKNIEQNLLSSNK